MLYVDHLIIDHLNHDNLHSSSYFRHKRYMNRLITIIQLQL